MARRLDSTYETPLGTRTLSSSTRNVPASSRIRSMPETWIRTPFGAVMPCGAVEVGRRRDEPAGHDAVGHHACPAGVDVGEERLERADPLETPA